ncbi:DarT ssDNA thymidine ADP-ribosyltransferase family protein [Curtobacterium sp. MCBD17_028]|uniref:DarT ssDNA thymidine ADP-ribosyltransferase family protein n=1 Tax=Curtobacterium sp. MCBD17_028 TaxID=2175670 RepID=UPI000DA9E989|nr:DarT ssDNA thymidine ADP-ribosyltransferase family protein [Curtobacterium sp. MCBD17_028]PZE28144.1 hypothetical protein DEI86_06065 [Curtobacterium sp. MCBD17_028]
MTDECIHGFPVELCDICTPRQRAEPVVAPARAPRRARPVSLRSDGPSDAPRASRSATRTAAPVAAEPQVRPFASMRAHHWTHRDNLAAIVAEGALLAASSVVPEFDVSAAEVRAARAAAATPDGGSVADHVAFVLTPEALTWQSLRTGAEGDRWSEAARRSRPVDYVMLVVPTVAFGASVIVTDLDAEDPAARSAVGPEAAGTLLRRASLQDPELQRVELLAGPRVPFSAVAVVGVPNDRVRDDVRSVLAEAGGHAPRVAVFPPWFRPTV